MTVAPELTPAPPGGPAPVLSVVMPSFNQVRFLPAAVRSVLTQPVADLELLVMDGGSTDGSVACLAELARQFPPGRLRWCSGPDGGPAPAINRGVRAARAPLIGWLNSDDLYTPEAAARAVQHLQAHPGHALVYGPARHVDADGADLGAYPTLPPSAPLAAWADGCPICQPSVFFRRQAFLDAGGLDERYRAAFDFELWLRLFRRHGPQGVGFLDTVQAFSRLHHDTITARFRERVAREGIRAVHQHLGPAPVHWLLTLVDERCARHPHDTGPTELAAPLRALADELAPQLDPAGLPLLRQRLAHDARLNLATPDLGLDVHPDGWAGPVLCLRLAASTAPWRHLHLQGRHAGPFGRLQLSLSGPDGQRQALAVVEPGPFDLHVSLPVPAAGCGPQAWEIHAAQHFVPAQTEPGSLDTRALSWRVEGCHLHSGGAGG